MMIKKNKHNGELVFNVKTWQQSEITPGQILFHQMVVRDNLRKITILLFIIMVLLIIGFFV